MNSDKPVEVRSLRSPEIGAELHRLFGVQTLPDLYDFASEVRLAVDILNREKEPRVHTMLPWRFLNVKPVERREVCRHRVPYSQPCSECRAYTQSDNYRVNGINDE